ncbi:MAG: hypothetical protein WA020_08445 [Candidatus Acidiferrales bacterium]
MRAATGIASAQLAGVKIDPAATAEFFPYDAKISLLSALVSFSQSDPSCATLANRRAPVDIPAASALPFVGHFYR